MDRLKPTKIDHNEAYDFANRIIDMFNENHTFGFYEKVMFYLNNRVRERLRFKSNINKEDCQKLASIARELGFVYSC